MMSSNRGGSTCPFSDSAEYQDRVGQAIAEHAARTDATPLAQSARKEPPPQVSGASRKEIALQVPGSRKKVPAELEVSDLTEAFHDASLASSPEARLVLACSRWPGEASNPAIIRLPQSVGSWEMLSVEQRTHDVNFTIQLPFYTPPCDPPNPRFIPHRFRCDLFYNPADDNCLLVSRTGLDIWVSRLGPEESNTVLGYTQSQVVDPGLWRISVKGDKRSPDQHLVDILILRRRFSVSIHEPPSSASTSAKRSLVSEDEVVAKRRRAGDTTEILITQPAHAVAGPSAVAPSRPETSLTPATSTPSRALTRTGGTPLLDLKNGELAIIRTGELGPPSGLSGSTTPSGPVGPARYELRRHDRIARTRSASVFTSRHSALAENVVAKVIRYEGRTATDLAKCAMAWRREKMFLERLRHRNIVALKAFDGRFFAMYVEHLPESLHRTLHSPFTPSDASTILRDTSSALSYLAAKKIVHNDIKPGNIAYSPERGAVLLDFGLAMTTTEAAATKNEAGTSWYIPPGVLNREVRGAPGDVWALGVTMLYVLGKMDLPEKTTSQWAIKDVAKEGGDSNKQMKSWLKRVENSRKKLDRKGLVEGLIYQMLEEISQKRVQAAQILTSFESASIEAA